MQEFNIKGKTTITAEVKAQVDDSPIALPPKEGASEYILPFEEAIKDATTSVTINNSVIKELGGILPQITSGFHALNDAVNKTAQKTSITEIKEVNKPENQNQTMLPVQEGLNPDAMQPLVDAVNYFTDKFKDNGAIMKEFGDVLPALLKNVIAMNDAVAKTSKNLPSVGRGTPSAHQGRDNKISPNNGATQGLMQIASGTSNTIQNVASGNMAGAITGTMNGIAGTANNLSKLAAAGEMTTLASGLIAGGVVAGVAALGVKAADSLAQKFLEEAPTIYGTGKAFGSTNDNAALRSYQELNFYNKGTGLEIREFQDIAQQLRRQGVANDERNKERVIGDIAQTTSRWAYATGGDASQYAELAGIMSRYGGSKNVSEDFNRIVTAGYASGLQDTQIPEFLSGIKKVMEDGIAKGFNRSATEVADTLLMFSKMSGNSAFWQGEQGARLLSQVNSGIASATSLSKTEDILVYRAMERAYEGTVKDKNGKEISKIENALGDTYIKGGGYLNIMQLIEKGVNQENFDDIKKSLDEAYGDNTIDKIEALRKMTGLNYNGASRLWNLDAEKVTDTDIKNIMTSPENQNKETRYQEAMNDIKGAVIQISSGVAAVKVDTVQLASNIRRIANKIAPGAIDTGIKMGASPIELGIATSIGSTETTDTKGYVPTKSDWVGVRTITDKDKEGQNQYVRVGEYGQWINTLTKDDEDLGNEFLKAVFSDANKNNKWVKKLGERIYYETEDGFVPLKDRSTVSSVEGSETVKGILKELYDLFKQGLLVTYQKES